MDLVLSDQQGQLPKHTFLHYQTVGNVLSRAKTPASFSHYSCSRQAPAGFSCVLLSNMIHGGHVFSKPLSGSTFLMRECVLT